TAEGSPAPRVSSLLQRLMGIDGGRGGIRTHEGLAPLAVFKTAALNHSATLPSYEKHFAFSLDPFLMEPRRPDRSSDRLSNSVLTIASMCTEKIRYFNGPCIKDLAKTLFFFPCR